MFNCIALCMQFSVFFMISFPNDTSIFHNNRSHQRVGTCPSNSLLCQFNGS